ncbi:MAG: hypothetical protein VX737_03885 [Pseudomonadota bacterium]|nr:hypothetical protein [Pseudomonadota bacterium]
MIDSIRNEVDISETKPELYRLNIVGVGDRGNRRTRCAWITKFISSSKHSADTKTNALMNNRVIKWGKVSDHYEDTVWEFTIEFVRMTKNKGHFHGEEKNSISVSTLWQCLQPVAGKVF